MQRIKQVESRESSSLTAALGTSKSGSKLIRGSSMTGKSGSRISGRGTEAGGTDSLAAKSSNRPIPEGFLGVPAAANWGEKDRTVQQVAWWRGTSAPKDRSGSAGADRNVRGEPRRG